MDMSRAKRRTKRRETAAKNVLPPLGRPTDRSIPPKKVDICGVMRPPTLSPYLSPLLLLLLLSACTSPEPSAPATAPETATADRATSLVGTWELVELSVTSPTYLGEDTTLVEHVREADWGRKYGVRPARTDFLANGKLVRVNQLRNGQEVGRTHGLWKFAGDSLLIIEPNISYRYLSHFDSERMTLTGIVDYDGEKEQDDRYEAVYRLVGRTR